MSSFFNKNYLLAESLKVSTEQTQNEASYLSTFIKNKNSQVLELCCGHGRLSNSLYKMGVSNITGLDYSEDLIAHARAENSNIEYICADIQNLSQSLKSDKKLELAFALYNSFSYWDDNTTIAILKDIERALSDDSVFIIDFIEPETMSHICSFYDSRLKTVLVRLFGFRKAFTTQYWCLDTFIKKSTQNDIHENSYVEVERLYFKNFWLQRKSVQNLYPRSHKQWMHLAAQANFSITFEKPIEANTLGIFRKQGVDPTVD